MTRFRGQGAVRLERATAAVVRAIARRDDITVSFCEKYDTDVDSAAHVRLPGVPEEPGPDEITWLRGEADSAALRLRHHDPGVHRRWRPANEAARTVFDALEIVRYETLGARHLPGVAENLAARLNARCLNEGFAEAIDPNEVPESTAFALLMRLEATGRRWPKAADRVMEAWLHRIDPQVRDAIRKVIKSLDDQDAFAVGTHRFLVAFGRESDERETAVGSSTSRDDESGGPEAAEASPSGAGNSLDTVGLRGSSSVKGDRTVDVAGPPADAGDPSPGNGQDAAAEASSESAGSAVPAGSGHSREAMELRRPLPYHAFTTEYDIIATPEDFLDSRELLHWRKRLDHETAPFRAGIARLAAHLQQRLLARRAEKWDSELEEGLLDSQRLASVVADPSAPTIYKALGDTDSTDTFLAILIDSSASMRGLPIRLAAMCADIVALALERCAVKIEILGFTTREWRGGRSRAQWIRTGRPPHPGRLNDLCHIVYKSASVPWQRARNGLGVVLDETLLKENVDGEALLWARRRLLGRPEQRRILLVLSDGAPADESTSAANSPSYLEHHLREVIARIERERAIELVAIGLGHDVGRHYRRAVQLADPRDLGETIVHCLDALLL